MLRPDLVLILGWAEGMPIPAPSSDVEFVIADLTYSAGYNCEDRIRQKQAMYAPLVRALRARGWRVRAAADVKCEMSAADESLLLPTCHEPFVFFLGTTGEVYNSTLSAMRAFEIDRDCLKPLAKELHLLSVKHTCSILSSRRALDATTNHRANSSMHSTPPVTGEG